MLRIFLANFRAAAWHRFCALALLAGIAGCASLPHPRPQPPAVVAVPPAEFTIAAGALDTWNAIGQILVRLDGVTYQGRAQMLGLYDVDFRDDRFLIVARALALTDNIRTTRTQVRAALRDGKPDHSAAAIELLGLLQARLPDELHRIASAPTAIPAKARKSRRTRH